MKLLFFQNKGKLPATIMAVAFIACLGFAQKAEAAVTWVVSQVGNDVKITATGTMSIASTYSTEENNDVEGNIGPSLLYVWNGAYTVAEDVGQAYSQSFMDMLGSPSAVTGHSFGYSGTSLYWDYESPSSHEPGSLSPDAAMTFSNKTIDDLFGSNLASGPVLLWVHDEGGDAIYIARELSAIPEPTTSFALPVVCLSGLLLNRRRRR